MSKKPATIFACVECGAQATKWLGRCPECNAWNSYAAEESAPQHSTGGSTPVGITDVEGDEAPRISTRIPALDRVLGG
ncbi:MAG TPA: DNA repair protein RadA, partial [Thermoanaerobaculia bacterium]|nr:DNA repair protein RadA [Thermoanaerobaculia bacterium]